MTALALAVRWPYFHQSLFGDELFLYLDVHGRSLGQVLSAVHDTEKTPPLGFMLAWLFARGSDATVLVRLPSVIASVATVPLLYLLGARTVGKAAGFAAALLYALSPFAIFYGSENRAYGQVACLVVLSTLALVIALEDRRIRWWALYVLATAAAVYTHYIAALVLVPQAAWALWTHRESARQQLVAGGVVVLLFVPWLPFFVTQARHSGAEARRLATLLPLTSSSFVKTPLKALAGHPFAALAQVPGKAPLALFGVAVLGLAVAAAADVLQRHRVARPSLAAPGVLLALLAVFPLVALALYSLRPHTSFYVTRNLAVAVPYALLLIGWLIAYARRRAVLLPLSLLAVACMAVGTAKALSPDRQRPDARGVTRYIAAHAPPGAPVIDEEFPFTGSPSRAVRVYLPRSRPVYGTAQFSPAAWRAAFRNKTPVFIVSRRIDVLLRLLVPPKQGTSRFGLVASHTTRGFIQYAVREFAPR